MNVARLGTDYQRTEISLITNKGGRNKYGKEKERAHESAGR